MLFASTSLFAAVVQPLGTSSQVLIPSAGSAPGAFGTFFKSDITLVNLATHDQIVGLQWLPQASVSSTPQTTLITIPALTGVRSADFVSEVMHQSGIGAIIVTGLNSSGNGLDSSARLFVTERIWTPSQVAANSGTASQSFPAIPLGTINTPIAAFFGVGGADNVSAYRVNVGIVNVDPVNTQTFVVQVAGGGPVPPARTVTLPPLTMEQVGVGSGLATSSQIQVQNTTPLAQRTNNWTAYMSTVDNFSGDAWSEMAVVGTTP